jgi:M6 family metalloprotease-like protein
MPLSNVIRGSPTPHLGRMLKAANPGGQEGSQQAKLNAVIRGMDLLMSRVTFVQLAAGLVLSALLVIVSTPPLSASAAGSRAVTLSGWLEKVHRCVGSSGGLMCREEYALRDARGDRLRVLPDDALSGALRTAEDEAPVVLGGTIERAESGERLLRASSVLGAPQGMGRGGVMAELGNKRYLVILVRFSDAPGVTPHDTAFYQRMMSSTFPGMDHYWRELSYGKVNVAGSDVVGWYNLAYPESAYENNGRSILKDAVAAADPDVYLPDYYGINVVVNKPSNGAWASGMSLNVDGQNQNYRYTRLTGYMGQGWYAHEMGHTLGLWHTWNEQRNGSAWDPMGSVLEYPGGELGGISSGANSYNRSLVGWIGSDRVFQAAPGTSATVTIERLSLPSNAGDYLMARIPIFGLDGRYYTVEARRKVGYDQNLPAEGVVIHHVDSLRDETRSIPVDITGKSQPRDAGAAMTVGQSFEDPLARIRVAVVGETASGYVIQIDNHWELPAGRGLNAEYFSSENLTGVPLRRVDPQVQHEWEYGSPDPSIPVEHFSARWSGFVRPDFTETYTFHTSTDDGVRLWVNGQLVIDQFHWQPTTEYSAAIALETGRLYGIRMEYFDSGGFARARLSWSSPSTPKGPIPPTRLYRAAADLGFHLQGRVTRADGSGFGGVRVSTETDSAVTNSAGFYSLFGIAGGTQTVTAFKAGSVFEPPSYQPTVSGDWTGLDFAVPNPHPALASLSLTPLTVKGGQKLKGIVELSGPVTSPVTVDLTSGSPLARIPASITIYAGSRGTFSIKTSKVKIATQATITATLDQVSRSAILMITGKKGGR